MSSLKQSKWFKPAGTEVPKLHLLNTLTKKKELFIPAKGNYVSWYICGPTVYDKSHLGHARTYISFDIVRRIMEQYFGYDVLFVMNITDVDDKYLFNQFKLEFKSVNDTLIQNAQTAWKFYVEKRFSKYGGTIENLNEYKLKIEKAEIPEAVDDLKQPLYLKTTFKAKETIDLASKGNVDIEKFFEDTKDVLSLWLDSTKGDSVTDPKIYRDFAAYWEDDYFKDMELLKVRKPDVLTRVSEYIPEIVEYVEKIIQNGYGYELEGSIYFDSSKFDKAEGHSYAKLEPWSASNVKLAQEGEGDLATATTGKRNPADFALWKNSKKGEPAWKSPWGLGRPGWHIECSVMASAVLGENMDIHGGGSDLAFPHHDNELAQSEETLEMITASQFRLMFLLHHYESVLDYSDGSISEAKAIESTIQNFLSTVKAVVQQQEFESQEFTGRHNFGPAEHALLNILAEKQAAVRVALCDSFNTPSAMNELRALISQGNQYYVDKQKAKSKPNASVLNKIASYVTKMLRIFGVFDDTNAEIGSFGTTNTSANREEILLPILHTVSSFRDNVRNLAQEKADPKEILKLCDKLRDDDFIDHGVLLEDREDGRALVKLVDKTLLLQQRNEKNAKELARLKDKENRVAAEAAKRAERLAKGKTPPSELFKTAEYSAWDEQGLPTKDKEGVEITKSKRKKLEKEFNNQAKLHAEYLAQ
ncbi:hypothetical protein HDV02_000032 [Globomyces sp. JEL0801]|nr:hypothetical protein HDV02_000032 [Globomyces sp. JEL0801]